MALIDDLLNHVTNSALREELTRAIADLRKLRQFGLVFEAHIPETVGLPDLPLVPGGLVRLRTEPDDDSLYRLVSVNTTKATIAKLVDGEKRSVPKKELRTVKRFGDPIYPALESVGVVRSGSVDRPHHAIISGENFHALQLLIYLYERQVDCIYIDPPYNSGARDWKYNNRYVDENDDWRHSKWLSFMQKRLALAKRLLKPDGVLVVMIDKNEHHHLGVLLEQEFKEYDTTSVCIVHNSTGVQGDNFSYTNEFAIFVTPRNEKVITRVPLTEDSVKVTGTLAFPGGLIGEEIALQLKSNGMTGAGHVSRHGKFSIGLAANKDVAFRDWGPQDSKREDAANCFYPIFVKDDRVIGFGEDRTSDSTFHPPHHTERADGTIEVWPIDTNGIERKWRYARQSVEAIRDNLKVKWSKQIPQIIRSRTSEPHKTVWYGPRYDAKYYGTQLVKKLTGSEFPFPKSVLAVRDTLYACVADKPNALILDFFAGSGTTFHATCMLNEELGGARRCILVTNNEVGEKQAKALRKEGIYPGDRAYEAQGIFEDVTVPRCKAVVLGRNRDNVLLEGDLDDRPLKKPYAENVEFFRIRYLDADQVDLGTQYEAILPALWLSAGGIGEREHQVKGSYSLPVGSTYAVLLDERHFRQFKKAIKERPELRRVWLVTDSEEAFIEMRSALPRKLNVSMLYRDYLRTFRINTMLTS
jgi:adenine-specific DNA-methyltransferase